MTSSAKGPSPSEFAGLGLQFAVAILLFLYVGQWFDRKLGTSWLAIVGAFAGAALGFFNMYRKLMAAQAADEAERKAKREQGK